MFNYLVCFAAEPDPSWPTFVQTVLESCFKFDPKKRPEMDVINSIFSSGVEDSE